MKRWILLPFIIVLTGVGCQSTHEANKKAAVERWKAARSNLALELAYQQFERGDLDKAQAGARKLLEVNTDDVPARVLLGRIALEKNQIGPAINLFEQAVALNDQCADAYFYMGVAYERQEDLDNALISYQHAWQLRPEHVGSFLAVAETMVSQGRRKEAWDLLQKNIKKLEHDARLYLLAGNLCMSLNWPEDAVSMYRQALNYEPNDTNIMESLGLALYQTKQWREALIIFEQMATMSQEKGKSAPMGRIARMAMGDCYLQLSRFHQAQRCFESLSQDWPDNALVWIRLAQASLGREEPNKAERYAQRALRYDNTSTEAQMVLGLAALKRNDYQQARKEFKQVISREKDNVLAYCYLGKTYQLSGDGTTAQACYREALQLKPDDPLPRQLMEASATETTKTSMP